MDAEDVTDTEIAVIHCETRTDQVVVAVILFDGHNWTLKTVAPPELEMMRDLRSGLVLLADAFDENGFGEVPDVR